MARLRHGPTEGFGDLKSVTYDYIDKSPTSRISPTPKGGTGTYTRNKSLTAAGA